MDAMGGDRAPAVVVEGAVMAVKQTGASVRLVGDEETIRREISTHDSGGLPIEVVHTAETIPMKESAGSALRKGKGSSIAVGLDLVGKGEASAFVSAGNSGAVMALAMHSLGTLPGIERPALATLLPTRNGSAVLIDCGANVECAPWNLVQFAVMGEIYARVVLGCDQPRLGIVSNGGEDEKGTGLTRSASRILRGFDHLNYIGYVEGRDILDGSVDVIVADGFTGNVILKALEGLGLVFKDLLHDAFRANWRTKLGYWLAASSLKRIFVCMDYAEYGGAPLLGVGGVAIVAHGGSNAKAVMNAIRVAHQSAERDVNGQIIQGIERIEALREQVEGRRKRKRLWSQWLGRFASRKDDPGADGF